MQSFPLVVDGCVTICNSIMFEGAPDEYVPR
jgi:hypothetical protein